MTITMQIDWHTAALTLLWSLGFLAGYAGAWAWSMVWPIFSAMRAARRETRFALRALSLYLNNPKVTR